MKKSAYLAGLAVSLIWSLSWVVSKGAQTSCGPLLLGTLSALIGLIPALPWMRKQGWPGWTAFLLAGGVGSGGFMLFAQEALAHGGAGKTILLLYSMPFWAILIGWIWLRDCPSQNQKIALTIASIGLLLAVAPWEQTSLLGGLLALMSGACWGLGTVATRHFSIRRPTYSPMALSGWQMLATALLLLPSHFLVHESGITWCPQLILSLVYGGLFCGTLAWLLWNFMIKHLPLVTTSMFSLLVPVLGVIAAWIFLSEKPAWNVSIGLLLVVIAMIGSQIKGRTQPKATLEPVLDDLTNEAA